jgi:hypothetical protein
MGKVYPEPPDGFTYVFVSYVTRKNGTRVYASAYGLRAFRILVKA